METEQFILAFDEIITAMDTLQEVKIYMIGNQSDFDKDKQYYKDLNDLDRFYYVRLGQRYTKAEREIINVDSSQELSYGQEQAISTLYDKFTEELEGVDDIKKTLAVRILNADLVD